MSSASKGKIYSPEASLIPAFLASDNPPFSLFISFIFLSLYFSIKDSATSLVLSGDPSLTIMISHSLKVWFTTDSTASGR